MIELKRCGIQPISANPYRRGASRDRRNSDGGASARAALGRASSRAGAFNARGINSRCQSVDLSATMSALAEPVRTVAAAQALALPARHRGDPGG
jgi:hypothetical protein